MTKTVPSHPPTPAAAPKVLIIDDSRLVRASIAKHLRGSFQYVEVGDGQAGWENIVLDPEIRIVISDIQMPKLDGYELLQRIRASAVSRIRHLPVIIISGSEEEAQRAASLGATEFMTKSVGTVELLSRLEVLMQLAERVAAAEAAALAPPGLRTLSDLEKEAERMWSFTRRHGMDLVFLCMRLDPVRGLPENAHEAREHIVTQVVGFITDLLLKAVRREDCLARTAEQEFVLAAMGISPNAAIKFAERLSQAVVQARIKHGSHDVQVSASFGIAAASQTHADTVVQLRAVAVRRCEMAQRLGGQRVVGMLEEADMVGKAPLDALELPPITLAEALDLLARGQERLVIPHLTMLLEALQPLLALGRQHQHKP